MRLTVDIEGPPSHRMRADINPGAIAFGTNGVTLERHGDECRLVFSMSRALAEEITRVTGLSETSSAQMAIVSAIVRLSCNEPDAAMDALRAAGLL